MPQDDIAAQWKSFDPEKRDRLLKKMSPEQKKKLRGVLEAKSAAPATTPGELKRKLSAENLTSGYDPGAQEFADKHPVAGPAVRFLSAAGGAAMAVPGQIVHAFTDPLTPEETEEFKGHTRIPGEVTVERLTGAPLVRGVEQYVDPKTRPSLGQAVSVLPEALGTGVGTVAGSEVVGKGLSEVGKLRKAAAERFAPSVQRTARKVTGVEPAVKEAVTKTAEKHGEALADTEEQKVAAKERAAQAKTVDEHSVKVKKAIEGVERKAYEEGNQKFDAVREKIPAEASVPADQLVATVHNAETATLQNIPENIKEFRAILRHESLPESIAATAEQHGFELEGPEPLTWNKLQSLKSRLDARLRSRSPMNGDLKRALFQTRDAVVDEMGKLADAHGAKAEWQAARDFWRQYKEDFTDSKSPLTHTLDAADPAKMRRPLVGDAQSTLGNRGAEILRKYPQHGGTEAAAAVEGMVSENSKLKYLPDKNPNPPAPKVPTVDVSKVAKEAIAKRAANWGQFNARDVGILSSGVVGEFLGSMFGSGTLDRALGAITGVAAYEGGKYTLSRLLNRPGVIDYLAKIPDAEVEALEKIPGADKIKIVDGITGALVQGKVKNISPGVQRLIGPANVAKILAVSAAAGPKTPGDARERMRSLAPNQP